MKNLVCILSSILGSHLLYPDTVNATTFLIQKDTLDCAVALGLDSDLETVRSLRQQVIESPTEENWFQFKNTYNHFEDQVAASRRHQTTHLHEAAMHGSISAINDLVENQGIDIDKTRGAYGTTPLFVAHTNAIPRLLALGADVNASDALGATPLHAAVLLDQPARVIHFLLNRGAHIEAQTLLGHTPIISAIIEGNESLFHTLRSRGASLNVDVIVAKNALLAIYIYPLIIDNRPNYTGFLSYPKPKEVQRSIRTTMARLILDTEPSLLYTVDLIYRSTPLHWAGFYGDIESMTLFLERGLSPTVLNGNGETPLHVAARSNQVEAFLMLKDEDPSLVEVLDKDGRTPIESARHFRAWNVLRVATDMIPPNFFVP